MNETVEKVTRKKDWSDDPILTALAGATHAVERKLICAIVSILRDRKRGALADRRDWRWVASDLRQEYPELGEFSAGVINRSLPNAVKALAHPAVSTMRGDYYREKVYSPTHTRGGWERKVLFLVVAKPTPAEQENDTVSGT